ncbi:tubulin polyglutamylase TTLL6 [Trichonephila clavata]|uniref:Tubulin polyglutamylase TTLL6 n=1 Tax=Trichonephila clavata TaxID=2740835 RepID=A0A8X6M007_TRICU|nr:tubulin polyglutamylase TTLL6 [Trichonephila clavata]
MAISGDLIDKADKVITFNPIITGDEKWRYLFDIQSKRKSSTWTSPRLTMNEKIPAGSEQRESKDRVHDVFTESGATVVDFKDSWVLAWVDHVVSKEYFSQMKPFQRINHFPGMNEICKKDLLSDNIKKMKEALPQFYDFFPLTFCLPKEKRALIKYCEENKSVVFIIKPDTSCQGEGIDLVKGLPNVKMYRNVVCQKYICQPLLMKRFKFDLRLYVLLTSVSPLRVYIYNEGLVRLATIPYKKPNASNMHKKRMHLTNYAVNKRLGEGNIELLKDENCKKSLQDLEELLTSSSISVPKLWARIDGIIVKTIISALPTLQRLFQMTFPISTPIPSCFELLGFDILLAKSGKPYLLEVNRSPSLGASTSFDKEMKRNLIKDILNMILLTPRQINLIIQEQHQKAIHRLTNPSMTKKLTAKESILTEYLEKKEIRMMGNFRKLYPVEDDRYDEIHRMSFSLDSRNMNESKTIQNRRTKEKEKMEVSNRLARFEKIGGQHIERLFKLVLKADPSISWRLQCRMIEGQKGKEITKKKSKILQTFTKFKSIEKLLLTDTSTTASWCSDREHRDRSPLIRDAPLLQRPLTPSVMALRIHASITLLVLSWCRQAFTTCPECAVSDQQQATRIKLEAIKQQILSKLHLQDRPNITSPLAREVALEALRRTQGGIPDDEGAEPEEDDTGGRDDYYARTSEIIAFAEPGE